MTQLAKVKTHRSLPDDMARDGEEVCEYCGRLAHYWSQASEGNKARSRAVAHCQRHRGEARRDCVRD